MGQKKDTKQTSTSAPVLSPQMQKILYGGGSAQPNMNSQGNQLPAPPLGEAAYPPGQGPMKGAISGGLMGGQKPPAMMGAMGNKGIKGK